MRYANARAFRAALEARLKNQATADEALNPALLNRLRKRVTFERFLARLQQIAPGDWVLKGGFALELRLANVSRTTKDIDVDWKLAEDEAVDLLLEAAGTDLGDHFQLRLERVQMPPDIEGHGLRWRLRATVADKTFETVIVDIGLEKKLVLDPVTLPLPDSLEFAGLPPIEIQSTRLEQHIAEKVHAYTKTYGPDDEPSSRVKDLIDIALVAVTLGVDGSELRGGLDGIFDQRATHPLPAVLPPPPSDWADPWKRLSKDLPIPDEAIEGHALAASLVDPALKEQHFAGTWDPNRVAWTE